MHAQQLTGATHAWPAATVGRSVRAVAQVCCQGRSTHSPHHAPGSHRRKIATRKMWPVWHSCYRIRNDKGCQHEQPLTPELSGPCRVRKLTKVADTDQMGCELIQNTLQNRRTCSIFISLRAESSRSCRCLDWPRLWCSFVHVLADGWRARTTAQRSPYGRGVPGWRLLLITTSCR
jgi:hypothetical protein